MKDVIREKLNKIPELEQKRMLRTIINGVLCNVIDYNENMYQNLEENMKGEIKLQTQYRTIYTALANKEDYDSLDDVLFPMIPVEKKDPITVSEALLNKVPIHQIYMECSAYELNNVETQIFSGSLETEKGTYPVKIRLKKNQGYVNEIGKLYEAMTRNNIKWYTVNCPFAFKMYDIVLEDAQAAGENETILSVEVYLERLEEFKRENKIILWNVHKEKFTVKAYPVPVLQGIRYQYDYYPDNIEKYDYIVALGKNFSGYVTYKTEAFSIIAESDEMAEWEMYAISKINSTSSGNDNYRIASNKQNEQFYTAYRNQKAMMIRTKAEIRRLFYAFEMSNEVNCTDIYLDENYKGEIYTYDMNEFIDEIEDLKKKKNL